MIRSLIGSAAAVALLALTASVHAQAPAPQPGPAAPATEVAPAPAAPAATPAPTERAAPAPTANAPAVPSTADDCLKAASDLVDNANAKQLAAEKLDRIDDLLTKMEAHCDAKQYKEAMGVAGDIKGMIESQ